MIDTVIVIVSTIALPAIGGIVWLVRLEGNAKVLDTRIDAVTSRVTGLEERITRQLDRIETRLNIMYSEHKE